MEIYTTLYDLSRLVKFKHAYFLEKVKLICKLNNKSIEFFNNNFENKNMYTVKGTLVKSYSMTKEAVILVLSMCYKSIPCQNYLFALLNGENIFKGYEPVLLFGDPRYGEV